MTGIDEKIIRQTADAMASNGMKAAGYEYVILDDGWDLAQRVNGHLQPDPRKFPNGIKALANYVHSKGLKFGIYACRGTQTCQGLAGSFGHEAVDAADFAAWGVDYLKYDNCNPGLLSSEEGDYRRMKDDLSATGRPIIFSICAWHFENWMPSLGKLWRTTQDLQDNWDSLMSNLDENEKYASFSGPGQWNDPDMLVVACGGTTDTQHGKVFSPMPELADKRGMTQAEYQTHFSLWAEMAAPLIAGNDVRRLSGSARQILLNREVIAVDQDPLGLQGVRVWKSGQGLEIYSKRLQGKNRRAVVLLNRSAQDASMKVFWADLGISVKRVSVRDIWAHVDRGNFENEYKAYVPSHGVVMIVTDESKKIKIEDF